MTLTAVWTEADDPPWACVVQGGIGPFSWDEYQELWTHQAFVPLAFRGAVEGLDLLADRLSDGYFQMSDGTVYTLTQRACADLLQAIANKREGYMRYFGPVIA
jgi:hypothetical protein